MRAGSNLDVPSKVAVKALGDFAETQILDDLETLASQQFEHLRWIEKT